MMNAAQEEEEDNSNSSDAVAAATTTTTTRTTTTPEEEEERLRLAKDVEKVGAKPCARKVGPFGLFPFFTLVSLYYYYYYCSCRVLGHHSKRVE